MKMALNSKHLFFVGSYAGEDQPGIAAFLFDSVTGETMAQGAITGIKNPSYLTAHPNGRWLYAVSETGQAGDGIYGAVCSFRYKQQPFSMEALNQQSTRGDWPCHVQIDRTGRWIVASNYGSGSVALFPILEDGALGTMATFLQHEGQGPNRDRQEGPHAHSATFSPDNRFLIVADLGIDRLVIYRFDAKSGSLDWHGGVQAEPGAGPRHLDFDPDGQRVYVANELNNTLAIYDYDEVGGALQPVQSLSTLPDPALPNSVADIHVSAKRSRVYVSNRGHNSLAVFDVEDMHRAHRTGIVPCGGEWPRSFALDPDEAYILVANRHSHDLAVLPVVVGGTVGPSINKITLQQPSCVKFGGPLHGDLSE
jgi:6-phosphogluconolactonase